MDETPEHIAAGPETSEVPFLPSPQRADVWRPATPFWRSAGFWVPLIIVLAAAAIRLIRLGEPRGIIPLDEDHYVPDARQIIRHGSESHFIVHPAVGKWFIAAGIKIFGDKPFGWRFFGALLGTLGVLLLYHIAMRLWGSRLLAGTAASLLAVEGLWFVHSRIAMLDVYLGFFLLLSVWLLLEDRARTKPDHRGVRWWRLGAGLAMGLALSSKFLAIVPYWLLVLGLAAGWEVARGRAAGAGRGRRARQAVAVAGTFLVLPVLVYAATWAPWFVAGTRYEPPRCETLSNRFTVWACYQREIYEFHQHLAKVKGDGTPKHPYFGEAWSWPWIGRPIAHYYVTTAAGAEQRDSEVLGLPNPAIWWPGFFIAFPALGWWALRRDRTAALIALFIGAGWLPFLVVGAFGRPIFFFYATAMVPFLVLGVVHALGRLVTGRRVARRVLAAYVAIAVGMFGFFYPVLAAVQIPHSGTFGWQSRIWFDRDCTATDVKDFCWI